MANFLPSRSRLIYVPPTLIIAVLGLGLESLHRRPGLDQRAVDAEVVRREQPLDLRLGQHRRQELSRDLAFQEPVAVLRESRMSQAASSMPRSTNKRNNR